MQNITWLNVFLAKEFVIIWLANILTASYTITILLVFNDKVTNGSQADSPAHPEQ